MNQELTEIINNRIDQLKNRVKEIPSGGGLESLRLKLDDIQENIKSFVSLLNELEKKREVHDGTKQKST